MFWCLSISIDTLIKLKWMLKSSSLFISFWTRFQYWISLSQVSLIWKEYTIYLCLNGCHLLKELTWDRHSDDLVRSASMIGWSQSPRWSQTIDIGWLDPKKMIQEINEGQVVLWKNPRGSSCLWFTISCHPGWILNLKANYADRKGVSLLSLLHYSM